MILEHGTLEDGRRYAVLEELGTFCPLGIRFWDAVADDQIRDSLRVRAWPVPALRPVTAAFRTVSDIYAFQGLPGLRDIEHVAVPPLPVNSPPPTRPFVVEVRDRERRFLPVAFRVDLPLPARGVFMPPSLGSPAAAMPGFYLFSSPVRTRPPQVAAVRSELIDFATGRPAPWAVVRVTVAGQGDRWGLADASGRVAVQFPLPLITPGFGQLVASPGPVSPPGPPVADRTWDLTLSVFWEPSRLAPLPGTDLPDLAEVLQQGPADVFPDDGSPAAPAPDWPGTLPWDGELFAATSGQRHLVIAAAGSP